ncbi:hypothetical protein M0R72_15075 [Candidatus Pacearchaeota archaeon]|nr:hypothetical protein [Candidatus Pacearchaeota archaeon]
MAALSGKYAAFFRSYGASTSVSGGAMTQVGATLEYYVTTRAHRLWDPAYAVVIYDGVTPVSGCTIDYAGGYVTLPAAPSGTVTCDFYYKEIEPLGGGHQWSVNPKADTKEVTVFPQALNTATSWREYIATLLSWDGSVKNHWFYSLATLTHGNITYTAKAPYSGSAGNAISIIHADPGDGDNPIDVTVAGTVITVSLETDEGTPVSTEAEVVAAVNLDAQASLLVTASYTGAGTDVVATHASAALTGGRDTGEEISKLGTSIMCEFYANDTTGSYLVLRGVGKLIGVSPDVQLESIVEGDLSYQGTGRLRLHTV